MSDQRLHTIDSLGMLYQKLERTFDRRPFYGEHQLDWVFDMAVTAWHMVDWYAIETKKDIKEVKTYLISKCPELEICSYICHGFKHRVLDDPKMMGFDVTKQVVQANSRAISLERVLEHLVKQKKNSFDIIMTPAVKVVNEENDIQALTLFSNIIRFWHHELNDLMPGWDTISP